MEYNSIYRLFLKLCVDEQRVVKMLPQKMIYIQTYFVMLHIFILLLGWGDASCFKELCKIRG